MSPFRSLIPISFAAVLLAGALVAVPASSAKKNGTFSDTGSMIAGSTFGTQTRLQDGRVLFVGGESFSTGPLVKLSSAEIYDPKSKTFAATGSMAVPRNNPTATVLDDGKVLIVGGTPETYAEIYDPATGNFSRSGSMAEARALHTASLLNDGRVLVAGGESPSTRATLQSAEIYDPKTGTFKATGSMTVPRRIQTASVLQDGSVLLTGGTSSVSQPQRAGLYEALNSAELYNPKKSRFVSTGAMSTARYDHRASPLRDGTVLVTGGWRGGQTQASTERYKPSKRKFVRDASMSMGRAAHSASVGYYQGQEYVLVANGFFGTSPDDFGIDGSGESYKPYDKTFRTVGGMSTDRRGQVSTVLRDRNILFAGGVAFPDTPNVAELYKPVAAPGTVTDVMRADVAMARATVTWKKPRRDGGAKVTNYQYRIKKKGKSWQDWNGKKKKKLKVSGTSTYSKTFRKLKKGKKLKPNTKYVIELRGKNDAGGGPNQKVSFRTQR